MCFMARILQKVLNSYHVNCVEQITRVVNLLLHLLCIYWFCISLATLQHFLCAFTDHDLWSVLLWRKYRERTNLS